MSQGCFPEHSTRDGVPLVQAWLEQRGESETHAKGSCVLSLHSPGRESRASSSCEGSQKPLSERSAVGRQRHAAQRAEVSTAWRQPLT